MRRVNPRIRAAHELDLPGARENAGLHEYDGLVQDLSPGGVAAGLGRLGHGPREADSHDEAHLAATEAALRTGYGQVEMHRWNPVVHLANLDLACYDREYAPEPDRADARRRHLAAWPDAVEAAVAALDRVPGPVATALMPAARGLAAGVTDATALSAHARLVAHLETAAADGHREVALGGSALGALMGDAEGMSIDLSRLSDRADREAERLAGLLHDACGRLAAGRPPNDVVAGLTADHPGPEGVGPAATALIGVLTDFTRERHLLDEVDGECRVGPAPESRRWAMAMMSWAAPYEPDAPSWYYVTPPDPSWPLEDQDEWMSVFSRTTLPAITAHEVTPGHFAHGRMLRRVTGDVRRGLYSAAFIEGWAHYAEELLLEEGFMDSDPRYCIGVCIEALVRVTRLRCALGIHTGAMTMAEAVAAFETDAFLKGPAARSEAERATYDPTYGRYTWGKLEILDLRDEAMAAWGPRYSHLRFHRALMELGGPPLGLIGDVLG